MGLSWLHKINLCLQVWEALSHLERKYTSIGPDPQMDFGVAMFNFFPSWLPQQNPGLKMKPYKHSNTLGISVAAMSSKEP